MLKAITIITIVCILTMFWIVLLFNGVYARVYSAKADAIVPFIHIYVPLTPDKIQFIPNQIMFHLDNRTSGAIESISNEAGKNITQYFKYIQEQNTVAVSDTTIYTHYDLQIPLPSNSNILLTQTINRAFDIIYIANPDTRFSIPTSTYFGVINNKFLSTNGIAYNKLNIQVIVPHDLNKYQSLMILYPSMK